MAMPGLTPVNKMAFTNPHQPPRSTQVSTESPSALANFTRRQLLLSGAGLAATLGG
jgi:hypothetical protein